MAVHEEYKRLDLPPGMSLQPCPVCAADAQLWQYSQSPAAPTHKAVMCSRGDAFGPQSGQLAAGCLLFMAPAGFYQPTMRQAASYWNEYATALVQIQRAGRWARARALREQAKGGAR